jgi:ABC-type lipoprotein export system ATPase subunit
MGASPVGALLSMSGISKTYSRGERRHRVLVDVALEVAAGEIVAVVGQPADGKTTLLRIAAGLERADHGAVTFDGRELTRLSDGERSTLLRDEIAWTHRAGTGVNFEILDYVGMPLVTRGRQRRREAEDLALEALERVGVPGIARRRWDELSNWERVMVAFARGIVRKPRLMIVDDVIHGLGMSRTHQAGELLCALVDELGCGVLMSASDLETALVPAECVWGFERGRLKLMSDQTGAKADLELLFGESGRAADVIDLQERARQSSGS